MPTTTRRTRSTAVGVELGHKRVFACALDWPGWCRSGKSEELALEALAAYAPRYAVVAEQVGMELPARVGDSFEVVERVQGSGATDFGVPHEVVATEEAAVPAKEAERRSALVAAAWAVLDRVVAGAPAELRKGPRGGGRDRDKMVGHVLEAEAAYARTLGIKLPAPELGDREAIEGLRKRILAVLREPSDGEPLTPKGWPLRYAARRIAWHVLDHAWEMQDRSTPAS
jgi:hypothetical protein